MELHKQTVWKSLPFNTCYRTAIQTTRQAVSIDICSLFNIWIILLGNAIFSCFSTDAILHITYSNISAISRTTIFIFQKPIRGGSICQCPALSHLKWNPVKKGLNLPPSLQWLLSTWYRAKLAQAPFPVMSPMQYQLYHWAEWDRHIRQLIYWRPVVKGQQTVIL